MNKKVEAFGKGGEPLPKTVDRFEKEPTEVKEDFKFTPDSVQEDSSLKEQLPTPTGYRLLVLPFSRKQKTKGGLYLANETLEKERIATNVGYVGGDLRLLNDDDVLAVINDPEDVVAG